MIDAPLGRCGDDAGGLMPFKVFTLVDGPDDDAGTVADWWKYSACFAKAD